MRVCVRALESVSPRGFDWQASVLRAFSPAGSMRVGRRLWGQGQLGGQRVPKGGHAYMCKHTHGLTHLHTFSTLLSQGNVDKMLYSTSLSNLILFSHVGVQIHNE